jgi:hypothetical protein
MRRSPALLTLTLILMVLPLATVALADHTNPRTPLSPTTGTPPAAPIIRGTGTWTFIKNFQANPGTDLKFFTKGKDIYASSGTLGQGEEAHVGQRIIRLTVGGVVNPQWVADHGSANCLTENPAGTTGLQHDAAVTGTKDPKLLIDTTDAGGRCHDGDGGGLELIDISGIATASFEPREVHLTHHAGFSHTVTVDATRPWIVYNSSSEFSGRPWIDVVNVRSCLTSDKWSLARKRDACRPVVHRIPFQDQWTQSLDVHTNSLNTGSAACHDITARAGRIYCAALNATLIFDVSNLTDNKGNVRGTPLTCTVRNGEATTGAKVTDCSAAGPGSPSAQGWTFLGTFNHPGRDCVFPHPTGAPVTNCNSNNFVRSDEGVSVSHESDPDQTGDFMFVTDERGGGVVAPGSSCQPGIDNPYGNGGAHVFDISDPSNIQYALQPDGSKAVYISDAVVPAATFCDIHVMEPIAGEQRFVTAYYSQGTKIVDYHIDANGRWTFDEVASFTPDGANTWVVQNFKTVRRGNTVTYFFMASDIQRGIDVFSWTGPAGPSLGSTARSAARSPSRSGNLALGAMAGILLPVAAGFGRRRANRAGRSRA